MRDIKNYVGIYAVTSCGRVWSCRRKKFLKPCHNKKGYLYVKLCKNGKQHKGYIHRLVAEAYIPNTEGLDTVDHIDNNKRHNYVNNLQWLSRIDNKSKDCPQKSPMKIKCIETCEIFPSLMECQRKLGCHSWHLSAHLRGKLKHVNGYTFERIE